MTAKNLYRFTTDFRRAGQLVGIFTATAEEIESIIGRTIYFGEVLGKHSEVVEKIDHKNFKLLTSDQAFVEKFDEFGCASGTNPFHYTENGDE